MLFCGLTSLHNELDSVHCSAERRQHPLSGWTSFPLAQDSRKRVLDRDIRGQNLAMRWTGFGGMRLSVDEQKCIAIQIRWKTGPFCGDPFETGANCLITRSEIREKRSGQQVYILWARTGVIELGISELNFGINVVCSVEVLFRCFNLFACLLANRLLYV